MKKHFKGFTLSELLLCIGIIGVVSAMGMTITKISTDRAYNLYYYTGYINLYNAIADAKANGIESNQEIMQHVTQLLSKDENNIAFATEMPFSSYKAVLLAGDNYCPSGYKRQGTMCVPLSHVIEDEKTTTVPPTKPNWSGTINGNGSGSGNNGSDSGSGDGTGGGNGNGTGNGSGDGTGGGDGNGTGNGSGDGTGGGDGVGWVEPNGANANVINGSNGIRYYYANSLNDGMNGVGTLQIASLPQGLEIPFLTYKAVLLAGDNYCPSGYKRQGTMCVPLSHVIEDEKTTTVPPTRPDWSGPITGNGSGSGNNGSDSGSGDDTGNGTGDGSGDGSGSGSGSGSGDGDVTPNGTITRAIPITMTVPQRKTRNNPDGFATVRLLYINLNGGYLIPITAGSSVDLQNRRDLLPAFIDDGKVGRNNALNRNNGFVYTRPAYGTYREMFCSLSGLGSIDTVISCNGINSNKTGALKVVDPRKAK